MNEELRNILKYLRLWGLLANWDELMAEARRGRFSHERLLKHVLQAEYRTKSDNARTLRRKRAHIPELLEIETFPFTRQPKLDRKRIMSLYDGFNYMCLVIDEVGYVEVEPAQVGLFFTLMQKRHKSKTTLLTSNLGFSEWGSFLKNNHLTAALVDRLTENSHVINMKNCKTLRAKLDEDGKGTSESPPK